MFANRWVLSSVLFFSTLSHAEVFRDCSKIENSSDMVGCLTENYQDSLETMMDELSLAEGRLKKYFYDDEASATEALGRLKKSQAAWEVFQAAQCELEGVSMLFGSGEALLRTSCLLDSTQKRIEDLKDVGSY